MAPICGKITLPKEYIKTQKITNGPKLITQSEVPAPKEIMVWTDVSVLSGVTGATGDGVTPVKRIPINKRKVNHLQYRHQERINSKSG